MNNDNFKVIYDFNDEWPFHGIMLVPVLILGVGIIAYYLIKKSDSTKEGKFQRQMVSIIVSLFGGLLLLLMAPLLLSGYFEARSAYIGKELKTVEEQYIQV